MVICPVCRLLSGTYSLAKTGTFASTFICACIFTAKQCTKVLPAVLAKDEVNQFAG